VVETSVGSFRRARLHSSSVSRWESTLSGTTRPPASSSLAGVPEIVLVVFLLCVDEDDIEDVLHLVQDVQRIPLDQLHPVLEPGLGDVLAPATGRLRIPLDRNDAPAQVSGPSAEQIVEYPREPAISSTSHAVWEATRLKRNWPVVGATARERTSGGSPCRRSSASSCSSRSSTARTDPSSI
jgi:hypothetical protein